MESSCVDKKSNRFAAAEGVMRGPVLDRVGVSVVVIVVVGVMEGEFLIESEREGEVVVMGSFLHMGVVVSSGELGSDRDLIDKSVEGEPRRAKEAREVEAVVFGVEYRAGDEFKLRLLLLLCFLEITMTSPGLLWVLGLLNRALHTKLSPPVSRLLP